MNATSEQDARRADVLRSLSWESAPLVPGQPKAARRGPWWLAGLTALLLMVVALVISVRQPDAARRVDAIVSALVSGVSPPPEPAAAAVQPEVAQPPAGDPRVSGGEITGSGFVVAPRTTTVFSKYGGRITRVAVELGDRVVSGQVLVLLEDAGARFALEQARAEMRAARQRLAGRTIDLAQARATLRRIEPLAAVGAMARQTLEDARVAVARASNALAQAEQELAGARLAIRIAEEPVAELAIRAPFAGTVTRLDARVGNTVLARADSVRENQSLLTITDMSGLVVDADVAETHIADLKPGLHGEAVLDGFPDHVFAVEVVRLAPIASADKGTIALRLSISDPPAGIRPNMAARIRISYTKHQAGAATL